MNNKLEELKAAVWDARLHYYEARYVFGQDYDVSKARSSLYDALDAYEGAIDAQ